jgi:hypothetical protein
MGDPRIVAIDWSGAKTGAAKKIWLAEARDGALERLEGGRDRDQIVEHLVDLRREGRPMVVGLDFGFSFPAAYLRERGFASAADAWAWLAAGRCADDLLTACEAPFWGRRGRRPPIDHPYRQTELAVQRAEGVLPKSLFQIGGAGAVGTGSIRGMCALHALRAAGFAIWPFDDARAAIAIEIYPRLFARGVKKSRADDRAAHLAALRPKLPAVMRDIAASNDDAFDAAVTALAMSRHAAELGALSRIDDPVLQREGIIWWPEWRAAHFDAPRG